MYSVTVKYVAPSGNDRAPVIYHLADEADTCDIDTGIRLYSSEWDNVITRIRFTASSAERLGYLRTSAKKIENDLREISRISNEALAKQGRIDLLKVANTFNQSVDGTKLRAFAENFIKTNGLTGRPLNKITCAVNSFLRYIGSADVSIHDIDATMMSGYEAYLSKEGLSRTTAFTYINSLRGLYNHAVTVCGIQDKQPFINIVTLTENLVTSVRPKLTDAQVDAIAALNLEDEDLILARDILLLVYHTGLIINRVLAIKRTNGRYYYSELDGSDTKELNPDETVDKILSKYDSDTPFVLPVLNPSLNAALPTQANTFRIALKPRFAELGKMAKLPFTLSYMNIR